MQPKDFGCHGSCKGALASLGKQPPRHPSPAADTQALGGRAVSNEGSPVRRAVAISWGAMVLLTLGVRGVPASQAGCGRPPSWLATATNGADVVVRGQVTDVELEELQTWAGDVVTYVTVRVDTTLKGRSPGDSFAFWMCYAAKKGERVMWSEPPLAAHAVGDEIVAFAEADAGGEAYSRGMGLQVSDGFARTPDDMKCLREGLRVECYESWVDSLASSRSPGNLALRADAVGVVRVRSVVGRESREDPVLERVTAVVLRRVKGLQLGAIVDIALPAYRIWDVPKLSPEEVALVFLSLREDGAYEIAGGREGTYLLDDETGLCYVSPKRAAIPPLPPGRHGVVTAVRDAIGFSGLIGKVERGVH